MIDSPSVVQGYQRYHIETKETPDIVPWPSRFNVKVDKVGLAKLLIQEFFHYRGDLDVVLSRPCLYGVFSGLVGGFAPRERLCVGCLRCTTQHPDFVEIRPNPARARLGDSYFTFEHVNAVAYEAQTGSVPVKGAGYRGKFGGTGWDGMWTGMSEIVRPTRDGIHGREFISTVVDVGARPAFLTFDADGQPAGPVPQTFAIPLPLLFDAPPTAVASETVYRMMAETAAAIDTIAFLPLVALPALPQPGPHLVPSVTAADAEQVRHIPFTPRLIEMDGWDAELYEQIQTHFPGTLICLRLPLGTGTDLLSYVDAGVNVFHLTADYHGRGQNGRFILDLIRQTHSTLLAAGRRDEVTLLGSGGIIAAEHVPKAIIAGLDAVVLNTPLLVALQAHFDGDFTHRHDGRCHLPPTLTVDWGRQRLQNLMASWRDQLLEIMGAMGLREVRRLRGEIGRAMFHKALEREAFAGIEGYDE